MPNLDAANGIGERQPQLAFEVLDDEKETGMGHLLCFADL